jgi:hypothetical protein
MHSKDDELRPEYSGDLIKSGVQSKYVVRYPEEGSNMVLKRLARKYVWWKTPDEAVSMPERVIAQVMNIGDYGDMQMLANSVGDDVLRKVLSHAEAGQFDERSWAYWHYRLGLAGVDEVPPLPSRRLA